ncbi:MAG: polysaccharide deacetylase family protein [Saprospiraceae bacterium]|nr:polysaccharide deacetylase family protein [Saprospiraceae bacterium]
MLKTTDKGVFQYSSDGEVPALSYHNIKDSSFKPTAYTIHASLFEEHLKMLKEKGFNSVLPEDIYQYRKSGRKLPDNPVMISFDDTRIEHFAIAAPLLKKYGFQGTFFIMTIAIGKKNYMSKEQIKMLSDDGHAIELHTWDHQDLRKLPASEWEKQIDKPKSQLENIIGKKVNFLAYPFGSWNEDAIKELKSRGIRGAFQLSGKRHLTDELYALRRLLVPGSWSSKTLLNSIQRSFTVC